MRRPTGIERFDDFQDERFCEDFSSLAGLRLAGSGFRHCRLHEADFSDADLSGCDFGRADLARARFANTNVRTNRVKGARVSLPEGVSLLQAVGIVVVDFEEQAAGEPPAA